MGGHVFWQKRVFSVVKLTHDFLTFGFFQNRNFGFFGFRRVKKRVFRVLTTLGVKKVEISRFFEVGKRNEKKVKKVTKK